MRQDYSTCALSGQRDKRDPDHDEVLAVMDGFVGRMITTAAVVTEAMHLASATQDGPRSLAEWVSSSGTIVLDVCQPLDLFAAARLMERYQDTPMDFAAHAVFGSRTEKRVTRRFPSIPEETRRLPP